jgi:TPR repeat protein
MKLTLKDAIAATILMLSLTAPVAAGPGEDAMAVSARGDYATALRLLRPLADQGDAQAQYNLGVLYDNGQGVPQSNAEAMKWYRKAADQGEARDQNNLANRYARFVFRLVGRDRHI